MTTTNEALKDTKLSAEESLTLISQMITEARGKLQQKGGSIFLIWGYTSLVVSLLIYFLIQQFGNENIHWLWFLIPIIGTPCTIFHLRKTKSSLKTLIDKIIAYIWITVGTVTFAVPILAFFVHSIPILFVEGLILNIGIILSGAVLSFRAFVFGGILGILLSFSFCFVGGLDQILIFALMFIVTQIIPGHILNYKNKRCLKN